MINADLSIIKSQTEKKDLKCNNDEVNILHLSDLHFGIEKVDDEGNQFKKNANRQRKALIALIDTLNNDSKVPLEWKPNIVVISGDIAWKGYIDEYEKYRTEFVKPLYEILGIPEDYIITCAGNHDIIRENAKNFEKPISGRQDLSHLDEREITRNSISGKRKQHFEHYINSLCGGDSQKLSASITLDNWPWLRFIVLNSSWDWREKNNEGTLRVGLNLLEETLSNQKQDDEVIIAVFHHPYMTNEVIENGAERKIDWLHVSERVCNDGELCFTNLLESKAKFILNGHIHQNKDPLSGRIPGSICLISGTTYSYDTVQYHCRILKISRDNPPRYIECSSSLANGSSLWDTSTPKDFAHFEHFWRHTEKEQKHAEAQNLEYAKIMKAFRDLSSNKNESTKQDLLNALAAFMSLFYSEAEIRNQLSIVSYTDEEINAAIANNHILKLKGPR